MKTNITSRCSFCLAILLAAGLLFAATPARADIEALVSAPISTVVVPGQPVDLFFSEPLDFIHHKDLEFRGIAQTVPGTVGQLDIQFDWFDPNTGGFQFSPASSVTVIGGAPNPFDIKFTLPFCPPEVSLHLTNVANAASVPIQVDGTFTYQCVPEPSTFVLFGFALVGALGYCFRRKMAH